MRNARFDHIAQIVPHIGEAVRWWRDNFPSTEVVYEDSTWAMLDVNGTKLAFVTEGQHPAHVAWRVSNFELERLAEQNGAAIQGHRDGTRSFYLQTPGDQWLELIAYPGNET